MAATRATAALDMAGIAYSLHAYVYDPDAAEIGRQAAEALGVPAERLLKTLMTTVDGRPVCALVPSDRQLSLKKLAATCAGKVAEMMRPADAERVSGYHIGGISPFGQRKRVLVVIEAAALAQTRILLNGGQRGLQVELDPGDACRALGAKVASIT